MNPNDQVSNWLKHYYGFNFNPFDADLLNAGSDAQLPYYIVGHEAFSTLWGDWPSFMFAPAGGGKTAFRTRLARACRIKQDNRKIFPITYKFPDPAQLKANTINSHVQFLCYAVASELLLQLAYKPHRYFELSDAHKQTVRRLLDANLPGSLNHFLAQLNEHESIAPLADAFDPTAHGLINPPDPKEIRQFCAHLGNLPLPKQVELSAEEQFEQLVTFIRGPLAYQAVYMLVDGVDAYIETAENLEQSAALLLPFINQIENWAAKKIFAKFFLPDDLQPQIFTQLNEPLTSKVKSVTINWDSSMLIQMLRERVNFASDGMFNSLDAISTPDLYQIEKKLVDIAGPLPRNVLLLVQQLLVEHVQHAGPTGKLEQADFEAAKQWYATR